MTRNNSNNDHRSAPVTATARRRSPWPLAVVAALFIIFPFMFWYGTWFGRALNDEEIGKYLKDEKNPRHIQHALAQIAERIADGDERVKRWYPQVVSLSGNTHSDVRMTVAWVMGQDNKAEEFHTSLMPLLEDAEPIVRRNAALSLVRFHDARSRPELLAMLHSYTVLAPVSGTVMTILTQGTPITREAMVARIKVGEDQVQEVRSPLPGRIEKTAAQSAAKIAATDELLTLAPDSGSVWEALRALYLVGEREDLAEVERYAQEKEEGEKDGVEGMSDDIRRQAVLTAHALRNRPPRN